MKRLIALLNFVLVLIVFEGAIAEASPTIKLLSQQCNVYFEHWDPVNEYSYTVSGPSHASAEGARGDWADAWIATGTSQTNLGLRGYDYWSAWWDASDYAEPSVELIFKSQQASFDMSVESLCPMGSDIVGLQLFDLTDSDVVYSATYATESHNLSFELDPEHSYRITLDATPLEGHYYQLDVTLPAVIPAPSAIMLGTMGASLVFWFRRHRS